MRAFVVVAALGVLTGTWVASSCYGQSSDGYSGSHEQLNQMIKQAQHAAAIRAMQKRHQEAKPAADGEWVDYRIKLVMPEGSPFPGRQGESPDLELRAQNHAADSVEHVAFDGGGHFYNAQLKIGQTYEVFMRPTGVVGGMVKVSSIFVKPGARARETTLVYRKGSAAAGSAVRGSSVTRVRAANSTTGSATAQPADARRDIFQFDVSGLPNPPTTFEEQRIWDLLEDVRRNQADTSSALELHRKLSRYYQAKGLQEAASKEQSKADRR